MTFSGQYRLVAVRNEIARRLERVCANLTPEEFEELLDRMTLMRYKYESLGKLPTASRVEAGNSALEVTELQR